MGNVEHITLSTVNVLKQDKLFPIKRWEEVVIAYKKCYGE